MTCEVLLGFPLLMWTTVVIWAGKRERTKYRSFARIEWEHALDIGNFCLRLITVLRPSNNPHILPVPKTTTTTQTLLSYQNHEVDNCGGQPIRIIPCLVGILKNGKLEKVVAIIKYCTSNALGNLTVTLKDLSSTISGTINYKVLTKERFGKAITVGAALILHNVSVFNPKQSTHHYLNITKKNMV
ncbi:transposase, MuDR, MULE transposase domain protein [Tanacetum coccineum]